MALLLGVWLFLSLTFFLKKLFFPCGKQILEMLFKYMCKFRTSSEKFEIRTIQISWKIYKILKTVEFFNMWLFISKIKNLNFCICQNTHFCCSGLGQVSSWWINSIFCVGKVSIWRCLFMPTFSGLHFLFYKYPMNFQQGLVQPPVD